MKKTTLTILLGITALLLFVGSANAITSSPFSSLGWVNPNFDNSWDQTSLTGKAQYSFNILDSVNTAGTPISVNTVELFFESDIFDTSSIWAVSSNTPNWTFSFTQNNSGFWLTGNAGVGAEVRAATAPLTFTVDYTLLSADRYKFGAGGDASAPWQWYEAQGGDSWSQEYHLTKSYIIPGALLGLTEEYVVVSTQISGGSTAPIPEPSTMILLGAGLFGLALYRSKRQS